MHLKIEAHPAERLVTITLTPNTSQKPIEAVLNQAQAEFLANMLKAAFQAEKLRFELDL